jgi:hypothetical protein
MGLSLSDIAPASSIVEIEGVGRFTVHGIRADAIVSIFARFPALAAAFTEDEPDAMALIKIAPAAVDAIIAAGLGKLGDEKEEAGAAALELGRKLDFLEPIMLLTFPKGIVPFMERLQKLAAAAGVASIKARASKLPKRSKS